MKNNRQTGLATVEFALISTVFFILMFGVIETGRAFFYWNTMTEATRRGVRVATICPPNDVTIMRTAVFNAATDDTDSDILSTLTPADIQVSYLDIDGNILIPTEATIPFIQFVSVAINSANTFDLNIPFFNISFPLPRFEASLWRESLGGNQENDARCVNDNSDPLNP